MGGILSFPFQESLVCDLPMAEQSLQNIGSGLGRCQVICNCLDAVIMDLKHTVLLTQVLGLH